MPRRKVDAAAVVFALLVVATLAAFAYSQKVKRDPLLVDRFTPKSKSFAPKGKCKRRVKLKFRTTTTNDQATVEVIRPGGETVDVLASKQFLKRYSYHVYHWDGTDGAGKLQPPGRYRLRVVLEGEGRSLTLPGTIRLHAPRQGEC
jgi:hypothetical protein